MVSVPYRCDDSQRRRAVRPLILADHCHVCDRVDGCDQRTPESSGKIFEIDCPYLSCRMIFPPSNAYYNRGDLKVRLKIILG